MADVNGDQSEPSLQDVICALTKSMQGFSTAIDEVKQVVKDLSDSIEGLSKGIDEAERKLIEEEEAWETVRDTGKEQQKETVDSWKDELNNLLVFAGLFSAVVTAFTVESYTWLQQDPGDASNALLAQLSLQLSMYMITFAGSPPSSAFANSTAPALSLSDVQSSFSPVSYAVSVNTLWVLSLTLSLISAFFAIAAQQWLRQLHLPPEMPVRRAVQLLEARKDGLKTWQVPSIIALLPLLLQIAVIFFLVGLFLLLRSLNATVAIAFGAVVVVGLLAFLATTVIPLITSQCPYKTPLIPTVVIVLQCLSYPLAMLFWPFAIFLFFSTVPVILCLTLIDVDVGFDFILDFIVDNWLQYLKSFGRHMFVDMGQFWLTREYQYILSRHKAHPSDPDLERSSLIQTFLSTPARCSSKVSQLLNSSKGNASLRGFRRTIVYSLRAFRTGLKWSDLIPEWKLAPNMAPYIGTWLSARHYRLLWQYLQQRDWKRDGKVTGGDIRCLILFHELDKTSPTTRPRYAKHLLQICAQQEPFGAGWAGDAVPTCLVLDLIMNRGYVPDEGDVDALLAFASKVYSKYRNLDDDYKRQLFLVSTALALIAVNKSGVAHSAGISSTVNRLAGALDEGTKNAAVREFQRYYGDVDGWSRGYPECMLPARIMEALCEALSDYAASPLLTPSLTHLHDLTRISASLREICTGGRPSYAERPEMQAACRSLNDLNTQIELITTRNTVAAESATKAVARIQARHTDPSDAHASGDHTAPTALQESEPNNEASPSDSATRTAPIDTVQANPTETDKEEGPSLAAATTDHNDLSQHNGNDAAAGSAASESVQTTPSVSDKGKERETPAIPISTSKPREAREIQDVDASPNGASSSIQGPEGPSASEVDRATAEDDASGNNSVEAGSGGEKIASGGTTIGE